jgi:hypothetical protein
LFLRDFLGVLSAGQGLFDLYPGCGFLLSGLLCTATKNDTDYQAKNYGY